MIINEKYLRYINTTRIRLVECGAGFYANSVVVRAMNEHGYQTFRGKPWTLDAVQGFLRAHGLGDLVPQRGKGKLSSRTEFAARMQDVLVECGAGFYANSVVARALNARGYRTFRGKPWNSSAVYEFIRTHGLDASGPQQGKGKRTARTEFVKRTRDALVSCGALLDSYPKVAARMNEQGFRRSEGGLWNEYDVAKFASRYGLGAPRTFRFRDTEPA